MRNHLANHLGNNLVTEDSNEMIELIDWDGKDTEQWWLAAPEHLLIWARLRVLPSGVARVFDSQGDTLVYESEDIARSALMDADFRALDGMDESDAELIGLSLDDLEPPQGKDDDELLPQMIRILGPRP